jgi:hypothetical protein
MKSHISGIQVPTPARINIDGGLTLDSVAGTSGHMMISQGTGNTPIWSNTLTSPTIVTSLLTSSTSFDLINTTATTVNAFGAATTLNLGTASNNVTIGNSGTLSTGTQTVNLFTGGSTTGTNQTINLGTGNFGFATQTINIGTGTISSATRAINIGSTSGTGTTTLNGIVNHPGTTSPIHLNGSAGTTGQVLTSAGSGATPTWNTPNLFTSGAGTAPGTNAGVNYPIFPSANDSISLSIGTYKVEFFVRSTVATSTVSATMNFSMVGSGTASGSFDAVVQSFAGSGTSGADNIFSVTAFGSGGTAITTASAVAGRNYIAHGNGVLRITTAGTIIPSIAWSSTLTSGSVTLNSGNYMMITQLSNSGTAASVGSWS